MPPQRIKKNAHLQRLWEADKTRAHYIIKMSQKRERPEWRLRSGVTPHHCCKLGNTQTSKLTMQIDLIARTSTWDLKVAKFFHYKSSLYTKISIIDLLKYILRCNFNHFRLNFRNTMFRRRWSNNITVQLYIWHLQLVSLIFDYSIQKFVLQCCHSLFYLLLSQDQLCKSVASLRDKLPEPPVPCKL